MASPNLEVDACAIAALTCTAQTTVRAFLADFTDLTPGMLSSLPYDMTITRAVDAAAGVTVQTSASTIESNDGAGIGANIARVFYDGTTRGLLFEGPVLCIAKTARNMNGTGWGVQTAPSESNIVGPDGVAVAQRCQPGSGAISNYIQYGAGTITSTAYTVSHWYKAGSGLSQQHQATLGLTTQEELIPTATTAWARVAFSSHTGNGGTYIPVDGQNEVASGGVAAGARDIAVDFHNWQASAFSTSDIITSGADGTRPGERLQHPIGATFVHDGTMTLSVQCEPKGSRATHPSAIRLFTHPTDATTYAEVSQSTGIVTVSIGGVTNTSGSAMTWAAGDDLEFVLVCGNGPSVLQYRINGGAVSSLTFTGNVLGSVSFDGEIDLLCDAATKQLFCVIQTISSSLPSWASIETFDAITDSSLFWDSSIDVSGSGYRRRNPGSRLRFTTDAAKMVVETYSNGMVALAPTLAHVTVTSDGSSLATPGPASDSTAAQSVVTLAGGSHTVEVLEGGQQGPSTIVGTFVRRITLVGYTTATSIEPTAPSRRMVVLGDSNTANGFLASDPSLTGWIGVARATYTGRITAIGWGGLALHDYHGSISTLAAMIAAACDGTSRNDVVIALGTNDAIQGYQATFAADLALLLADPAITAITGLHLYVLAPIPYLAEGAAMTTVRAACVSAAASAGATSINGTSLGISSPPSADYNADGIHLANAGHTKLSSGVLAAL